MEISLFSDRLSATFETIITFIFAASIAFRSAGNSIAICFVLTKIVGNRISTILILKMAIAELLVAISMMPFLSGVILMLLYTLMSRKLWKRKTPGNVTEERDKSSQQKKRRVIMADINSSCVLSSCYAMYDIFSKHGCLS